MDPILWVAFIIAAKMFIDLLMHNDSRSQREDIRQSLMRVEALLDSIHHESVKLGLDVSLLETRVSKAIGNRYSESPFAPDVRAGRD